MENIRKQFDLAILGKSEQHWLAIRKYFSPDAADAIDDPTSPPNTRKFYCRSADLWLGKFYLREKQLDDAEKVFRRLSDVEQAEIEFRANGDAGLAIVHYLRGEMEMASFTC